MSDRPCEVCTFQHQGYFCTDKDKAQVPGCPFTDLFRDTTKKEEEEMMNKEVEYGWMVEAEECGRAVWLCMADGAIVWSSNPNLAMRFCRCEDGAAMARHLCKKLPGGTLGGLRVTDHIWA